MNTHTTRGIELLYEMSLVGVVLLPYHITLFFSPGLVQSHTSSFTIIGIGCCENITLYYKENAMQTLKN